jgi:hypothetical protein
MDSKSEAAAVDKPAFEPSDLVEHGEADKLTRGPMTSSVQGDGNYTS